MGGLLETGNRLSRVIRCACSCFICFFKQIERRTSYRANIPCLSLWERWPSAARTERVDTLRKYASGIFLVSISAAMLP